MKIKLLFLSLLAYTIYGQAQNTKQEAYIMGTKLAFYPNACGNTIPEAAGKLTFCDRNGALGVVEESYGLNKRNVKLMLDNRANEDEAFITGGGLSIKKTDGTYENVPNIAIPDIGSDGLWRNDNIITGGLIMPNNKVLLSGNLNYLNIYDRVTKSISLIEFTQIHYPRAFAFDNDRDLAWIIAIQGTTRHLYSYNETIGLVYTGQLSSLNSIQVNSSTAAPLTYKDDYLYFGDVNGLYKIDINTLSSITYNATSTPSLPHNKINDLKFDDNGDLWIALDGTNNGTSDGSIIKFNIDSETYEQYQLPRSDNPTFNYHFDNLAIDNNGVIWSSASNYSGIIKLEIDQDNTEWEEIPLTDFPALGIKSLYRPDNIYFNNQKFYFTISNGSSAGSSDTNQILINDHDNWSSITDNNTGNISHLANKRFNFNLPDSQGGMWWFNSFDDIILHRKANDEQFVFTNLEGIGNTAAIDIDDNPIIRLGFPSGRIKKIELPIAYDISNDVNQNTTRLVRYKDEVWWYNENDLKLKVFKYNQVIATFDLDNTYNSIFHFDVDSNGNAWFAKNVSNDFLIKRFETSTATTTDFTINESIGTVKKIVAAPNGAMWFAAVSGLIYYDGVTFTTYLTSDYTELYNIESIIADTNNAAYVLLNDNAALVKIENPGTSNITFSTIPLEGANAILPALDHYRPSDLSIDSQGAIWTNASENTFKLTDGDTATEYRVEGETYNLSGLVYNDINENDVFDVGEEYSSQLVTLKLNGIVYNTFTDTNGIYRFYLYEENATYEIILPTIGQFVTASNRQLLVDVGENNQNYNENNFQLKPKFVNSLYVKSSSKTGAWGFVREGFENTYTTAIGNVSTSKVFNNLEVTYTFKNDDENSSNILPPINEVRVHELKPNGTNQLINKITINPINNTWRISVDPTTYVKTTLNIIPEIIETGSQTDIKIIIPTVSPLSTYIIEIDTGLYSPSQVGEVIGHGVSKFDSNDFVDSDGNPTNDPIILFPIEDRDSSLSGFDTDFNDTPYVDPKDIYVDPPYQSPKQVYAPAPYKTKIYSSYDPNDKLVDGGVPDVINDKHIDHKWLTYTIRFENSGNFSAKDIVITDVLDINLDPNSLKIIEASANYEVDILKNATDENLLKFSFNDIFLPFDDANNDGYIKFLIKANENIPENTIIENTANIYFDQNPAIITNTIQNRFLTITTLGTKDDILEHNFKMYPNPTNAIINVNSKFPIKIIEIFNILGKKVFETKGKKADVSSLPQGTYILKLTSENSVLSKKLIIN